ncbi:domain-containing protein [Fusarium coicis]|nr:domain-containing protein [Fusarium coicis]
MKVLIKIWFGETSYFQTEDNYLNCATIVLLQGYTSCRLAKLTDATKKRGVGNPLQDFDYYDGEPMPESDLAGYKTDATEIGGEGTEEMSGGGDRWQDSAAARDVEAEDDTIVKDPNASGRDMLAIEVALKFHKNMDRKPKLHVLARAIQDDTILVEGYDSAEPFFNTRLSCQAIKVHWKPHMLKIPVFRRTIRSSSRTWILSDIEAVRYSMYVYWLNRVGIALGYEDPLTSYCFRRGLVDALTHVAPDAIINQVIRHDPMTGCRQNAYLNTRVG